MKNHLCIIAAISLLCLSFQEKREMVVSENQVRKFIDRWTESQGKGDSARLARLYVDGEVHWNGKPVTLSQLLANKLTLFTTPVLKEDILAKSLMMKGYTAAGGLIKCDFTMVRKIDGKVREYPYYLLLVKESGKLKIVGEGENEFEDESLLGMSMEIVNVDIKDLPEETLTVISGRSYFYPLLTSSILAVVVVTFIIARKRRKILKQEQVTGN